MLLSFIVDVFLLLLIALTSFGLICNGVVWEMRFDEVPDGIICCVEEKSVD